MDSDNARLFFEEYIGQPAPEFVLLAQSGSARKNFIAATSGKKFIITSNDNVAENESFFYFTQVFSDLKLNTPEIFKISADRKIYVQEYLGNCTLSEILEKEGLTTRIEILVKQALAKLFDLQTKAQHQIDYAYTFEYEAYDDLPITNDLFYFKSFIADVLEIPYHKSSLLKEFKKLTAQIQNLGPTGLMIRDFQARNMIVNEKDEVFFIDYQSAMKGPLMYDVISFLVQAKAAFPENFKTEMLDYYYSLWEDREKVEKLKNSVIPLMLIRYLQVLGAYGFRGLIQKKKHFMSSIDKGIKNLYNFSENWEEMEELPELKKIISELNSDSVKYKIEILLTGGAEPLKNL